MRTLFYALDGRTPVACDDVTWMSWFATADHRVAEDTIDGVRISTVFLGLDTHAGIGAPVLFETMIFGGPLDRQITRCATWAQAEAMHAEMRARVKRAALHVVKDGDGA